MLTVSSSLDHDSHEDSMYNLPLDSAYNGLPDINIYTVTRKNDLHTLRKYIQNLNSKHCIKNVSLLQKIPKNKQLFKTAKYKAKHFAMNESKGPCDDDSYYNLPKVNILDGKARDAYTHDKRKNCLTKMAVYQKGLEKNEFTEVMEHEDSDTEYQESELRRFDFESDKKLKKSCQKVAALLQKAEEILKNKAKQNTKLKDLQLELSMVKSESLRLEETFKSLRICKEFLDECTPHEKRYSTPLSSDGHLSRSSYKGNLDSELSDDIKEKLNMIINFSGISICSENVSQNNVNNNKNFFNDNSLSTSEGEKNQIASIEMSKSVEKMVYFDNPEEFIEVLQQLESKNLVSIENLQLLDEVSERLHSDIKWLHSDSLEEFSKLKSNLMGEINNLKTLKKNQKVLLSSQGSLGSKISLKDFKNIFHFTPTELGMPLEELMQYIHSKIRTLYCSLLKYDPKTKMSTTELLYRLERNLDDKYTLLRQCPSNKFLEMKKCLAKMLRDEKREQQVVALREAEQRKFFRVLQKINQTVEKKWPGRKVIERSQPPKKKVEKVVIDWDAIRAQEEYQHLFTYKEK